MTTPSLLNSDPDAFWLHRLIMRLLHRQRAYKVREQYAEGNHPLPEGDPRFARALRNLQIKARTNYIGLAQAAVVDRMRVRAFKFQGEVDADAMKFWKANNMVMNSQVAIGKAARLSDTYALVSPPATPGGVPVITIEDPRICIVEQDPVDPFESIVGLRFYEDSVHMVTVAILYYPDRCVGFTGPATQDFLTREFRLSPDNIVNSMVGFTKVFERPNPLGKVPLIRGMWRPEFGLAGMAECEDGGWDIQDRINKVILDRLVIQHSQAYRQRWATGLEVQRDKKTGAAKELPFQPGADMVWAVVSPDTKFGDFEQADIRQLLEAARDDIGDFAAVTQTPVTYLTNKMVNVSGQTMTAAQTGLVSKAKNRMGSMGWFFEKIIKYCFLYQGDTTRAEDLEAETMWFDAEVHTMTEAADYAAKAAAAGFPVQIIAEKLGFSPEEVVFIVAEAEKKVQQEQQFAMDQAKASGFGQPPTAGKTPA